MRMKKCFCVVLLITTLLMGSLTAMAKDTTPISGTVEVKSQGTDMYYEYNGQLIKHEGMYLSSGTTVTVNGITADGYYTTADFWSEFRTIYYIPSENVSGPMITENQVITTPTSPYTYPGDTAASQKAFREMFDSGYEYIRADYTNDSVYILMREQIEDSLIYQYETGTPDGSFCTECYWTGTYPNADIIFENILVDIALDYNFDMIASVSPHCNLDDKERTRTMLDTEEFTYTIFVTAYEK